MNITISNSIFAFARRKTHFLIPLAAALLFCLCGDRLYSQNIEDKKDKAQKIEREIKLLDEQINKTIQAQSNTLNELVLIKKKVAQRKKLLETLDEQIQNQSQTLESKSDSLYHLENRLKSLEEYYRKLIISAYNNRDTRKWFMYIIAADNIEQGYRRWIYLKNYAKAVNIKGEELKRMRDDIIIQKEEIVKLQNIALADQQKRQKEYEKYKQDEKKSSSYAYSLEKRQNTLKKQLNVKKNEVAALNREIEKMLEAAIKQNNSAKKNTAQYNANIKLSEEFGANKGKLPWPIENGVVIEQFGIHDHPVLKGVKLPFNNGINISAAKQSNVTSVFSGIVKQIIIIPGYNHCVLVQHGNYFTFYCKLGTVAVNTGDKITTGSKIGNINDDVLHFELWNGSTKQNPEYWLR